MTVGEVVFNFVAKAINKSGDDVRRYCEKGESERLQRLDLKLDAILISILFIKLHGI